MRRFDSNLFGHFLYSLSICFLQTKIVATLTLRVTRDNNKRLTIFALYWRTETAILQSLFLQLFSSSKDTFSIEKTLHTVPLQISSETFLQLFISILTLLRKTLQFHVFITFDYFFDLCRHILLRLTELQKDQSRRRSIQTSKVLGRFHQCLPRYIRVGLVVFFAMDCSCVTVSVLDYNKAVPAATHCVKRYRRN